MEENVRLKRRVEDEIMASKGKEKEIIDDTISV